MTRRFAALLLAAFPFAAFAHSGHGGHGFLDVFTHFFLDLDHLLAVLLVVVVSALLIRQVWPASSSFLPWRHGEKVRTARREVA